MSVVNGQVKCLGGAKGGEANGRFLQVWMAFAASLASFHSPWIGWVYAAVVTLGSPFLVGSWLESSVESSNADTVSASGRMMTGAFFRSKPTTLSNTGSIVSEEVATRRVIDTQLAGIHYSFFAAFNASDVLMKSDSS